MSDPFRCGELDEKYEQLLEKYNRLKNVLSSIKEMTQNVLETYGCDTPEDEEDIIFKKEIKHYPLRISGQCPVCDKDFFFDSDIDSFAEIGNCTTDCAHCGALLMIENFSIYPFHEKLNGEDPRWPKDGKNTSYISVNEEKENVFF